MIGVIRFAPLRDTRDRTLVLEALESSMSERLYTIQQGERRFIAGLARGKQVLLGNKVHEIVAHWFDMKGLFHSADRRDWLQVTSL
jgi:hypothetical protein